MKAHDIRMAGQHLVPPPARISVGAVILTLLCPLLVSLPALSQNAEMYLEADTHELALGDTLTVWVGIDANDLKLTSAALYITFDHSVFYVVPESVTDDGMVEPFVPQAFFAGQVYDNHIDAGEFLTTLSFVTVTNTGFGADRPAVTGRGRVASFRLRTIAPSESGFAAIRLVKAGQGQPTYTELDRPGRQAQFRVRDGQLNLAIFRHGLLPFEDLILSAGGRATIDLSEHHRAVSRNATVLWTATSSDPQRVEVRIEGELLEISSPRRHAEGTAVVHYAVDESSQKQRGGEFSVTLVSAPRLLASPGITLAEDALEITYRLASFLKEGISAEPDWVWSATGGRYLDLLVDQSDLRMTPFPEWSGDDQFLLTVLSEDVVLDSITVIVTVTPVNDHPDIAVIDQFSVSVGEEVTGPQLAQFVRDPDHPFESLRFTLRGDEHVGVSLIEGHLVVRGLTSGTGTFRVEVEDPEGGKTSTTVVVVVDDLAEEASTPEEEADLISIPEPVTEEASSDAIAEPVKDAEPSPVDEATGDVAKPQPPEAATGEPVNGPESAPGAELPDEAEWLEESEEGNGIPAEPTSTSGEESAGDGRVEPRLRLVDIPEVTVPAGESVTLDLNHYVEGGREITWKVTGEEDLIHAQIVDGHLLQLELAESRSAGKGVLLITATGADGEVATEVLRVTFSSAENEASPSGREADQEVGAAAADAAMESGFELASPEPLEIEAGAAEILLTLDDLVRGEGNRSAIIWSVRGGSQVTAEIAHGQLHLVAAPTASGQEVFELEAQRGSEVRRTSLVINVHAPRFEVVSYRKFDIDSGETITINLDEFLVANLSPEAIVWEAEVSDGGRITLNEDGRSLSITAADTDFQVTLTARHAASDLAKTGQLEFSVVAPPLRASGDPGDDGERIEAENGLGSREGAEVQPLPEVSVEDPTPAAAAEPVTGSSDQQPPQLRVSTRLVGFDMVVEVVSDEALSAVPVVRVDGLELSDIVAHSNSEFSAAVAIDSTHGSRSSIIVEVEAADRAGNGGAARSSLTATRIGPSGGRAVSIDGQVQLHIPAAREPVPVLIRADDSVADGAYWIEFDNAKVFSAELHFSIPLVMAKSTGLSASFGVLRQAGDGLWQPVPSQTTRAGSVLAMISESGLYKLGESSAVETGGSLELIYPNPFNSRTVLRFQIDDWGPVSVTVFDVRGAVVKRLVEDIRDEGIWTVGWDGTADSGEVVSSGVYLVRILAAGADEVRKVTLAR